MRALQLLTTDWDYTDAVSGQSTDSEDSSEEEDNALNGPALTQHELQSKLRYVSETVNRLCGLARIIRSSGIRSRVIKASNYEHRENGINLSRAFERDYLPQVLERRFQLTGALQARLCKAISQRRRFFMYQDAHQKRLTYGGSTSKLRDTKPRQVRGRSTPLLEQKVPIPSNAASNIVTAHEVPGSIITRPSHASTFHYDSFRAYAPSEMATSSVRSTLRTADIPPAPSLGERAEHFECPYCHLLLDRRKAEPAAWKRHVIADLQPYVCLEQNCSDPGVVLESFSDWVEHQGGLTAWNGGAKVSMPPMILNGFTPPVLTQSIFFIGICPIFRSLILTVVQDSNQERDHHRSPSVIALSAIPSMNTLIILLVTMAMMSSLGRPCGKSDSSTTSWHIYSPCSCLLCRPDRTTAT